MRYIIFCDGEDGEPLVLMKDVGAGEAGYLRHEVLPRMRPLNPNEYTHGPLAILGTAARSSYILIDDDALWCIEWPPGILVIRFLPDGRMSWCSRPSPNPNFGGRLPAPQDLEIFDEDAPNPQYNIVFDAWDAQFDPELRREWKWASPRELLSWRAAMAPADELGSPFWSLAESNPDEFARWRESCETSAIWRGTQSDSDA